MPTKKTPITPAALIKELRAIAAGLAHAGQSDMLDHSRVCSDTAASIRDWLRKVELAPIDIAIVIEGGLVQDVFCSQKDASVETVDLDCHDDSARNEADNLRAAELREEVDQGKLFIVA